jgi:hypothetical protein
MAYEKKNPFYRIVFVSAFDALSNAGPGTGLSSRQGFGPKYG